MPVEEEDFKFPDEKEAPKVEADKKDGEESEWKGMLPKEVETAFLRTPRGRQMLADFKTARELEKPPLPDGTGGLGYIPDAKQTKEAFAHSNDMRTMGAEFHSGDAEAARNWVGQWFLPQPGAQLSKGAVEVARQFLPLLADQANKNNPAAIELYRAAAVPAVSNFIEEMYSHAATMPDAESRTIWFNVARFADAHLNGDKNLREISKELLDTGKNPNAPDPRVTEIDSKLKRIETFEQQQQRERIAGFSRAMDQAVEDPLMSDIDAALGPIRENCSDRTYNALKKEFHMEVVGKVLANPANLLAFAEAKAQAAQNPTAENIKKAGKAWAEAARATIRSLRPQYINEALGPKAQESAERHRTLEEASQKRGAPSVAAPVGKDLGAGPATPQKLPDGSRETYSEVLQRRVQGVLSA